MAPTQLRIVHTVSSLRGGGMEHFVIRLAGALRKRGHDATVVAITHGPLFETARAGGVPTTVLRGGTRAQRVSHAAAHFAVAQPDIVHCHNPTSLQYAAIAKVAGLSRLVFTDHAQTCLLYTSPSPRD